MLKLTFLNVLPGVGFLDPISRQQQAGHEEARPDKLGSEQEFQVKPLSGQLAGGVCRGHSS